jgi:ferredoxin-NADP reductase
MVSELKVKIKEIKNQTHDTKSIKFDLLNQTFDYKAGQFIILDVCKENFQPRSYSLSSSPLDEDLEIEVKQASESGLSYYLVNELKVGDEVKISGPFGHFVYEDRKPAVLICAGSGLGPMISISKFVSKKFPDRKSYLIYSCKTTEDIIFEKELRDLEEKNPNFKLLITITRPNESKKVWEGNLGRVTKATIADFVENLQDKVYFVCGPKEFANHIFKLLEELGINKDNVKIESWG